MRLSPTAFTVCAVLWLAACGSAHAVALTRSPYRGAISAESTGRVLFSDRAGETAYIASVTKLMTALLVFEDVRAGRYGFDTVVTVTPEVRECEPSWVGLKTGDRMSVRDLMYALMVESANDAALVLGVHSAGTLKAFVERMNARAAELGMSSTKYYNPNGLPPGPRYSWKSFNVSTAADQLILTLRLVNMPEVFEFSSVKSCDLVRTEKGYRIGVTYASNQPVRKTRLADGEKLIKTLTNHNNIMRLDRKKIVNPDGREAVDGLKTGYIDAGGSSIVLTGTRGGKRAVVVVLGSGPQLDAKGRTLLKGSEVRDEHASRLLTDALGALCW